MAPAARFDPLAPSPYPAYEGLRRDAPVYRVPGAGYYVVTRLDDVRAVAREPDLFSSQVAPAKRGAPPPDAHRLPPATGVVSRLVRDVATAGAERCPVLATADPPDHGRQRQVAARALGTRRAPELEALVRTVADGLLD